MVSPSEKSVSCIECHSSDGRLKNLTGFYLPGRDENSTVEFIGIGAIVTSILGVIIHALVRIFSNAKRNRKSNTLKEE